MMLPASSARPFHELPLEAYLATSDSTRVSKRSILGLASEEYTSERLSRFGSDRLRALAFLWGVPRTGPKPELIQRIIRRKEFRNQLAASSLEFLLSLSRKQLAGMAREAGLFHSALNKNHIAQQLVSWKEAEAKRAAREIGTARHFRIVRKALISGLNVPVFNLERYGLTGDGATEPTIFGMPCSVAARMAPEAIVSARELTQADFVAWVNTHPDQAHRVALIEAGAMYDGGASFWRRVRKAFEPPLQSALFD